MKLLISVKTDFENGIKKINNEKHRKFFFYLIEQNNNEWEPVCNRKKKFTFLLVFRFQQ